MSLSTKGRGKEIEEMSHLRTILISGCDENYFDLLAELIDSLNEARRARAIDLGIMNYGLTTAQVAWLEGRGGRVVKPIWRLNTPSNRHDEKSLIFASRLFFPEEFPGYDIYFWIDSDAWLQESSSLDIFIEGADSHGAAVVAEHHPSYRFQPRLTWRNLKSFIRGYGIRRGLWLFSQPHINLGVFAIKNDAPHWTKWRQRLVAAAARTGKIAPHDQFAFNQIVYEDKLPTMILAPEWNWIVDRAPPCWSASTGRFVTPDTKRRPIGIVHLAGPAAKGRSYTVPRLDGASMNLELRYSTFGRLQAVEPTIVPQGR
jgi:lipopolysaccharide biosynthesis glycosyltransferase